MNLSMLTKPLCRFLIHRYMGQWLRTEIQTDQLEFGLADGTASVQRVSLNTECINEVVEPLGVVSVLEGYVEDVSICVPWKRLMTDSTVIKISGMELTVAPMSDINLANPSDLVSSMIGSMASSKDLARSMIEDKEIASEVADAGVEYFAGIIDQMIKRIQVIFQKVTIRVEASSPLSTGLEIQIDEMVFMDYVEKKSDVRESNAITAQPGSSTEIPEIDKVVEIQGVRIYTDVWTPFRDRLSSSFRACAGDEIEDSSFQSCYSTFTNRSMIASEISQLSSTAIPTNPILVAQFFGTKHTVNIKVANTTMPVKEKCDKKVSIHMELDGMLLFYLTPSQLVLLQELFSRLIPSGNAQTTTEEDGESYGGRPMRPEHFQKITEQFHDDSIFGKPNGMARFGAGGWAGQEQFYEMLPNANAEVSHASLNAMIESGEYADGNRDGHSMTPTLSDKRTDAFTISLNCPMMLGVVTYDDALSTENVKAYGASTDFVAIREILAQLAKDSQRFFHDAERLLRCHPKKLDSMRDELANLCPRDHIRFLSDDTKLHFESSSGSEKPFDLGASLQNCDICECLQPTSLMNNTTGKVAQFDLLKFADRSSNTAVFTLNVSNTKTRLQSFNIECNMKNGKTELDPSIIDRIVNIIAPDSCFSEYLQKRQEMTAKLNAVNRELPEPSALRDNIFTDAIGAVDSTTYSVKFSAESWVVDIRIPIADLSEGAKEFWKRNVYDEYLRLKFSDAVLEIPTFSVNDLQTHGSMILQCRSIGGTFVGNPNDMECQKEETSFVYASSTFGSKNFSDNNCIRLKIDFDTRNQALKVATSLDYHDADSSESQFLSPVMGAPAEDGANYNDGPFSRVLDFSEDEKNVAPMTRQELESYSDSCCEMSTVNVELAIPHLNLSLPSKKFFELVYNRFGNDFALWTARAPGLSVSSDSTLPLESFTECHDDSGKDALLNVTNDIPESISPPTKSHSLSFKLKATNANVVLQTINKADDAEPFISQLGANLSDAELFVVYGFNGDENVSHFTTHAATAELFHRNVIDGAKGLPKDVTKGNFLERETADTIIEPGENSSSTSDDNVAVGLTLQFDPKHNTKLINVAVGLRNTFVHIKPVTRNSHLWMEQFADFFNVIDYEVPGYTPPEPKIDFHAALNNVVINYKHAHVIPKSPMELRFAIKQCYVRSHVNESKRLRLRWEFHDSVLRMSKNQDNQNVEEDLSRFIKILEIGYFKFDMNCLTEFAQEKLPIFDFGCQNDYVKVWVCSDTVIELVKLVLEVQKSDVIFFAVQAKDQDQVEVEKLSEFLSSMTDASATEEQRNQIMEMVGLAIQESMFSPMKARNSDPDETVEVLNGSHGSAVSDDSDAANGVFSDSSTTESEDEFIMIEKVPVAKGFSGRSKHNTNDSNEYEYIAKMPEDAGNITFPSINGISSTKFNGLLPSFKYSITNLSVHLYLFGGNDFGDGPSPPRTYSNYYNSTGESIAREAAEIGGLFRDHTVCVEAKFCGISLINEFFDTDNDQKILSRHRLIIDDVEWLDHVSLSNLHKMVYMCRTPGTELCTAPFLLVNMSIDKAGEAKLTSSLMNIRLNLDQDSVEFLQQFGADIKEGSKSWNREPPATIEYRDPITEVPTMKRKMSTASTITSSSSNSEIRCNDSTRDLIDFSDDNLSHEGAISFGRGNVVSFSNSTSSCSQIDGHDQNRMVPDLLTDAITPDPFASQFSEGSAESSKSSAYRRPSAPVISSPGEIFIREFTFAPRCKIRFDFVGKRVKTDQGPLMGFIIGMMDLRRSEITLKALHNDKGMLGLDKVYEYVEEEWLKDIKSQFAGLVSSYRPISSLVELSRGLRDLFAIPLSEMQKKNGHVVEGIQQGASSFGLSTTAAALDATQNLALVIQNVASFAFDLVTPTESGRQRPSAVAQRMRVAGDMREGFSMAYDTMRNGMYDTTRMLCVAAQEEREGGGSIWGLRGLLRHLTPTALRPIVLTSQAAVHVLNGMKNQLKPDEYREELEKWRRRGAGNDDSSRKARTKSSQPSSRPTSRRL